MVKLQRSSKLFLEARNEEMVYPSDGREEVRTATFLRPRVAEPSQAVAVPKKPLLADLITQGLNVWPPKIAFRGWMGPQKKWGQWVERLRPRYGEVWNRARIFDAIMSTKYEVKRNQDVILGLSERWCAETNTFVFPWGEAAITLEDVMVLGGYPVLGEPVTSHVIGLGRVKSVVEDLDRVRVEISRSCKSRKASHAEWLEHFMEREGGCGNGGELEHAAFLSLWLSRFVFSSFSEKTVASKVFPLAVYLSHGKKVALGPAVLASLFHYLRLLRDDAIACRGSTSISGPFRLVQLWGYERFPLIAPKTPNGLKPCEPRCARWHRVHSKMDLRLVRLVLEFAHNFQWRPYTAELENWRHISHNRDTRRFVLDDPYLDEEKKSFARCLQPFELVGLDCREKCLPCRVAMQFGMDQDLPGDCSRLGSWWKEAQFYIPLRSFTAGVSSRYWQWWKEHESARKIAIKDSLARNRAQKRSSQPVQANKYNDKPNFRYSGGSKVLETRARVTANGEGNSRYFLDSARVGYQRSATSMKSQASDTLWNPRNYHNHVNPYPSDNGKLDSDCSKWSGHAIGERHFRKDAPPRGQRGKSAFSRNAKGSSRMGSSASESGYFSRGNSAALGDFGDQTWRNEGDCVAWKSRRISMEGVNLKHVSGRVNGASDEVRHGIEIGSRGLGKNLGRNGMKRKAEAFSSNSPRVGHYMEATTRKEDLRNSDALSLSQMA